MTDDLVTRLRDHENEGVTGSDRFHLRNEAADEIARLRGEVADSVAAEVNASRCSRLAYEAAERAEAERDALRTRVSELESGKRTWERDASRFKAAHDASFMQVVAERDALRRDAERYRWLRELPNADRLNVRFMGSDLDTVIDAALREGK